MLKTSLDKLNESSFIGYSSAKKKKQKTFLLFCSRCIEWEHSFGFIKRYHNSNQFYSRTIKSLQSLCQLWKRSFWYEEPYTLRSHPNYHWYTLIVFFSAARPVKPVVYIGSSTVQSLQKKKTIRLAFKMREFRVLFGSTFIKSLNSFHFGGLNDYRFGQTWT